MNLFLNRAFRQLERSLLLRFQHCCFCGAMVGQPSHLCGTCLRAFEKEWPLHRCLSDNRRTFIRQHLVLSLGSYRDPRLASWVRAMKGGDDRDDFRYLARRWLHQRILCTEPPLEGPFWVVPCPSRVAKENDHAANLARELSRATGWPLMKALSYQDLKGEQKSKNRGERSQIRFSTQWRPPTQQGTLIFVDDVVTTGSTALAAWSALGRPLGFEVWCLAHQPRLAMKGDL